MPKLPVIMPISNHDFDPSEAAVTWQSLTNNGFEVVFATIDESTPKADPMMLNGEGLDPWGWIPGLNKLKLIGLTLRADGNARKAFANMVKNQNFQKPKSFGELKVEDYCGLYLPGGHAPRMKPFLEDKTLQKFVCDFFETNDANGQHKPIAAVCHGALVAARAVSEKTGKSPLYGKKTTALTWKLENTAWQLSKYIARFWDANYYRTYVEGPDEPKGYWSVESEIKRNLQSPDDFLDVAKNADNYFAKSSGLFRDDNSNSKPAWVVEDGNYLSGRWPGDAHTLAKQFISKLNACA